MSVMKYKLTRRDFLNGIAIGTGTGLLAPNELFAQDPSGTPAEYYPPTLTGMRGNHPGSFDVSHALAWNGQKPAEYRALDEHHDLVIVGAGVSGEASPMTPPSNICQSCAYSCVGLHSSTRILSEVQQFMLGSNKCYSHLLLQMF